MTKEFALGFATHAHSKQKRKYTNEPYINHCINVASKLESLGYDETVICAALLHDTVEDTDTTIEEIEVIFGVSVAKLVEQLTDVYTSDAFPDINRTERKRSECERISNISVLAKSIKLADLIDNSSSIVMYDKSFAKVYLAEKEELLKVLKEGDQTLYNEAVEVLKKAKKELGEL